MGTRYSLAKNVLEAAVLYLESRPYNEVVRILDAIRQDISTFEEVLPPTPDAPAEIAD